MSLLRKQLTPDGDVGASIDIEDVDTLDSPGSTVGVTATTDLPDNPVTDATTNSTTVVDNPLGDENKDANGEATTDTDETDVDPFQQLVDEMGFPIELEIKPETTLVDLAKGYLEYGKKAGKEEEFEELKQIAPEALDYIKYKKTNPTATFEDFVNTKVERVPLTPESLDPNDIDTIKNILSSNFRKLGVPESQAALMAQSAIDTNTAHDVAKSILEQENKVYQAAKEERYKIAAARFQQRQDELAEAVERRSQRVKTGTLAGIKVPVAQQEAFIQATYYDAGNPKFPGHSAVEIKLMTMTEEQRDLFNYLVFADLDVNKLVAQRAATISTRELVNKRQTSNGLTSGGNRGNKIDNSEDTLDSPGR